MNNSQIVLC